jgi:hypothetical protein
MRKTGNGLLLAVLLIGAVVVGALIAQATKNVQYLTWLSYSKTFGLSAERPVVVDLSVLKFAFGFEISISVAQAICLAAAALLFRRLR